MGRALIPTLAPDASMTLSKVMRDCLQYLGGVKGYSPGTIDQYDRTFRQFLAHLQNTGHADDVRSFLGDTVLAWVTDLGIRKVSPNTIISKLAALSTLADFARRLKNRHGKPLVAENPTKAFDWPEPVKTETKFLHPNELQAFLEAECPLHEALARDMLLGTAIRVSEAAEANVGDVVEVDGKHFLTVKVKGRKRTGEEKKYVPVSPALAQGLSDYLLARGLPDPSEPLLVNRQGERWTRGALTQAMTRLGLRAGIQRLSVSAHKLRHTANVLARFAGLDPLTRSALLTHGSPRAVERYDHLIPGELHEARQKQQEALARYLGRRPPSG
jgi:site-specific recombinase XerD